MAKKAKKTAGTRARKKTPTRAATTRTAQRRPAARKGAARKGTARKTTAKKTAARKRKSPGRTPSAAFMAPLTPSPELAAVVGPKPLPRTEITKRVWAYIKKNKLQDPVNRRVINADDTLRPIFGGKPSVTMFELTKLINQHLR